MRLPRLFRTVSFKLAALYALVFGVSSAAIGGLVFINIKAALYSQEHTRIQSEATPLREEYRSGGLSELLIAIRERQRGHLAGGLDYTILRSDGMRIFGNLPRVRLKGGWKKVYGPPDGDEPKGELERLLVYSEQLSPDLWLLVGDDMGRVQELGTLILRVSLLGFLLSLILAVGGGAAVSAAFLRRIDLITRTSEAIIEGDIGRRIPLRGTGDDIDRLSFTLNRMLDRIAILMDTLRHVSNDIAHDLRSPLGRLRHALDEARRRATSISEYERAVQSALTETDAILETFTAILRIAQIESGSRRAGFRPIDLYEIATSVAQTLAPIAEESSHGMVLDIGRGILIDGDPELIVQLIINLIDNAIRHTHAGTTIRIGVYTANSGPVLEVSDNGPGVPSGEREQIFNRFYRCELSRTTPGNGLGLSLVSAIANLHKANIGVSDNRPGLCVRVEFPALRPSATISESEAYFREFSHNVQNNRAG